MNSTLFDKKNIIIDACMHLGDLLHATTVIRLIHRYNPDCKITFLVNQGLEDVFESCGGVERVITYKYKSGRGYLDVYKMAQVLKKYNFDASISLDPRMRLSAMMYLAGIPLRIGSPSVFGWKPGLEKLFFNEFITFEGYHLEKHSMAENFQKFISLALGVKNDKLIRPELLAPSNEDGLFAAKELKVDNKLTIAVCVNTVDEAKNLPADVYNQVIRYLIERKDAIIVGLGVNEDREAFEKAVEGLPKERIIDLVGKTNFQQLNAVLRRCDFLINPDNGMGHFAAAVACPTVTIFTNADSNRFKPLHPLTQIVNSACSCIGMCDKKRRKSCGLKCRDMVRAEMIIDKAEELIKVLGNKGEVAKI